MLLMSNRCLVDDIKLMYYLKKILELNCRKTITKIVNKIVKRNLIYLNKKNVSNHEEK